MLKTVTNKIIFATVWLGILATAFILYDQTGGMSYTILVITPRHGGFSTSMADSHNRLADIPITYASAPVPASITAMGQYHHVNIIGTNQYFRQVMSYFMHRAQFFTYEALENAHYVAILNAWAAETIFSERRVSDVYFYHEGRYFHVLGVIEDRDRSNANIYVPITILADYNQVDAIAFNAGIPLYFNNPDAIDMLHGLGIDEENYYIINLFAALMQLENFHELTLVVVILVFFEAVGSLAIKLGLKHWRKIGKRNEDEFRLWRTIFSRSFVLVAISVVVIALIAATIGMETMDVYTRILEAISTQNPLASVPETVFMRHIQELARWYFWIATLFWTSVTIFVLYCVVNLWRIFSSSDK